MMMVHMMVKTSSDAVIVLLRRVYFVSSLRKVIKSFRSLGFLRPPKAILVPGIYFLGFSRYSNCIH